MPIHLIDCRDVFAPIKQELLDSAHAALDEIRRDLDVDDIDFVFSCGTGVIPHLGYVGICSHAHMINVYMSPENANLPKSLGQNLKRMLAHEVHHCHRLRKCGERRTLAASLIGEGLADHFSLEIFPGEPERWCTALTMDQLDHWWGQAKPELWDENYNHAAWFFGMGEGYPMWAGYSLGFALVHQYMADFPGENAASLVTTPISQFTDFLDRRV